MILCFPFLFPNVECEFMYVPYLFYSHWTPFSKPHTHSHTAFTHHFFIPLFIITPFFFSFKKQPHFLSRITHPRFLYPSMDGLDFGRSHVPAFGSWDCNSDIPFTQCFDTAREAAGMFRYSYSEDRDLYVAGDLYENHVVTPAVIVVPLHRGKAGYTKEKEGRKDGWVVCDCEVKAPPSPVSPSLSTPPYIRTPKAVDEDLYKISPGLVRTGGKRKRSRSFFSCLFPDCLC